MCLLEQINGRFVKTCSKCKKTKGADSFHEIKKHFRLDSTKVDKLDSVCKKCRRRWRLDNLDIENKRYSNYYAPGTEAYERKRIRQMTRNKYGSATKQKCKKCNRQASEWHHLEYKVDSVIPLCEPCHESIS